MLEKQKPVEEKKKATECSSVQDNHTKNSKN